MNEGRSDGFRAMEERFAGYTVYDRDGGRIGKVDDLFLNESDEPEYLGVKMGFLGTRSTIIPFDLVTVDDGERAIRVSADGERVKNGPTFDDDRDITPEFEGEVYSYYGLGGATGERYAYGDYYGERYAGNAGTGMSTGDTDSGEFREHDPREEGVMERGDDLADEVRVQRSEEELRVGTREREAGALNIRKRVRTDREQVRVPTRREEVSVERVPVEGVASEVEIGDDEISVPIVEEEVIVEKRPVVKEELRIRKEVVESEEIVEADVRREEVDIDDQTTRRDR